MAATSAPSKKIAGVDRRLFYVLAAGVLLAGLYVFLHRTANANAAPSVTSGTPGPDMTGAAGDSGGGGASGGSPDSNGVVVDPVTGQVQQTNTASPESPTMQGGTPITYPSGGEPVSIGNAVYTSTGPAGVQTTTTNEAPGGLVTEHTTGVIGRVVAQ